MFNPEKINLLIVTMYNMRFACKSCAKEDENLQIFNFLNY
jgi:hypothetical protein